MSRILSEKSKILSPHQGNIFQIVYTFQIHWNDIKSYNDSDDFYFPIR